MEGDHFGDCRTETKGEEKGKEKEKEKVNGESMTRRRCAEVQLMGGEALKSPVLGTILGPALLCRSCNLVRNLGRVGTCPLVD